MPLSKSPATHAAELKRDSPFKGIRRRPIARSAARNAWKAAIRDSAPLTFGGDPHFEEVTCCSRFIPIKGQSVEVPA